MTKNIIIPRLPVDSFDWSRWRQCNIFSKFNFSCRTKSLINHKNIIRKYSIGYIDGSDLLCRPKENAFAVMLLVDDEFMWFHMTAYEFEVIFKD